VLDDVVDFDPGQTAEVGHHRLVACSGLRRVACLQQERQAHGEILAQLTSLGTGSDDDELGEIDALLIKLSAQLVQSLSYRQGFRDGVARKLRRHR
jgi:hypothetical protein